MPSYATSSTCSNMSIGRRIPIVARRSAHFGRTPVARNRPVIFPSAVSPVRSNTKMSCIVITSCSMPVISEMAVFFSSRRRHTRWTGDWSSDVCSSDLEVRQVGLLVGDRVDDRADDDDDEQPAESLRTRAGKLPVGEVRGDEERDEVPAG